MSLTDKLKESLENSLKELLDSLDENVAKDIKPRVSEIADASMLILQAAVSGENIDRELRHITAQVANLGAEKAIKTQQTAKAAVMKVLLNAASILATSL